MKKLLFLNLFILGLSIVIFSQTRIITVFEAVKIKNDKRAETLFYYENNWKQLRVSALEKGYIHSFELFEAKADEKADFDVVLITRYKNKKQFDKSEERFQELIKQRGELKLLNDLKPSEFRQNLFVKIGKSNLMTKKNSQNKSSVKCNSSNLKFFDFLVGNWNEKGTSGKKTINKNLEGCGTQEIWELEGFNAVLLRSYDEQTKKWYLTFTAHNLTPQIWEGRLENGNWYFYRDWELNGKPRKSRTYWKKASNKSFERIVEQLNDDGKTWRLHVKSIYEKSN